MVAPRIQVLRRDHPLCQVVIFAKPATVADRQTTRPPEEFQRGLRRVPVPPPGRSLRFALAHVRGRRRAVFGDPLQNRIQFRIPARALPFRPAAAHRGLIAFEFEPPHRVEIHRHNGRVVGPVFKGCAIAPHRVFQRARAILPPPRPQDQVMGPGQRIDTVDLDEAKLVQQLGKVRPPARPGGRSQQVMPVEEQAAGLMVGQDGAGHGPRS